MSRTSVVILNWNGEQKGLIRQYLPSVVRNTPNEVADVVVVDNGSTDNSLQLLKDEFPTVKIIALDRNYGFAEGYNQAIDIQTVLKEEEMKSPTGSIFDVHQMESPDYVVLLNDDVRVPEGWLEPMIAYMDAHPQCAALQPKILKDGEERMFEYAGACGGYLDNLCFPYCRGRIFDTVEEDLGQYDLPEGEAWPVMWASGACLMIRTELYLNVGGLDRRFFAHMEEIDLCWRLRRMGYDIVCVPQSKVYHKGGASLPQGNPKKTKLNFRNNIVMMWKNLPEDQYRHLIRRRKLLDNLAAANFLRRGQFRNFRAVYEAHREAERMIAEQYTAAELVGFGTARTFVQQQLSILWKYYKKGIRKYSDLGL